VACILLTALSQVYGDNWEQKAEQKDLKNIQFGQKREAFKAADKEGVVAKDQHH
jgi:hypothetical protein